MAIPGNAGCKALHHTSSDPLNRMPLYNPTHEAALHEAPVVIYDRDSLQIKVIYMLRQHDSKHMQLQHGHVLT